jgi:hypothetical protein
MAISRKSGLTEHTEQSALVRALRQHSVTSGGRCRVFAVPNGGSRSPTEGIRLSQQGVTSGVPDLILLGTSGTRPDAPWRLAEPLTVVEVAGLQEDARMGRLDPFLVRVLATLDARRLTGIEMKREGATQRALSEAQRDWLVWLSGLGHETVVGFGAVDALEKLKKSGW